MKVQINIDRRLAKAAIGQHLMDWFEVPTTKLAFQQIVADYVAMYGQSSEDNHIEELSATKWDKVSEEILNKFYQ